MESFDLQLKPEKLHIMSEKTLHNFSKKRELINRINVFPVADGDTGTNIELTIRGSLDYVNKFDVKRLSLDEYLKHLLKGMILNSRGCSGSILALYFKGFVETFDLEHISNRSIVESLKKGYESAYKGTVNPKEGTMLTIMREFYKRCRDLSDLENSVTIVEKTLPHLKETVERTPYMLKVLKDAGVVDSGALGFYVLLSGFSNEFYDEESIENWISNIFFIPSVNKLMDSLLRTIDLQHKVAATKDVVSMIFLTTVDYLRPKRSLELFMYLIKMVISDKEKNKARNKSIKFRYCTEFLFTPGESIGKDYMYSKLKELGEEIFIIESKDIFKIHLHTNKPETVLDVFKNIGDIKFIKVDDMHEQHRVLLSELTSETHYEKDYAILIILNGDGFGKMVKSLGDTNILLYKDAKPSVLEIIQAIDDVKSKNIIVAVDDDDILMALKIASDILKSKFNIEIIETDNIISVINMLYHNLRTGKVDEDAKAMKNNIESVKFIKVSVSNRSMKGDDISVKEGSFFATYNGKIISSSDGLYDAAKEAILKVRMDETLITLYSGRMENHKVGKLLPRLEKEFKDVDFELYYGGQNKYNYYVVFE